MSEDTGRAIQKGLDLFNAGRFWEAHEAWDAAWLVEDGDVRRVLQGLIQDAVARSQLRPAPVRLEAPGRLH